MHVLKTQEWQFDGLVGPTHNYAGLAHGNVASSRHAGAVSNPRAAALQGLKKMRLVRDLGMQQAFLPPHPRPAIALLQQLGFGAGHSRAAIAHTIDTAYAQAPALLAAAFSSAFMWTANAATITPSADTADGKLHVTPANLISHTHRAIEAEMAHRLLRRIFHDANYFTVHAPLPATLAFSDEGAANHMRVAPGTTPAAHVFVHGVHGARFMARQPRAAGEVIARRHGLSPARTWHWQQTPQAIDAGVFHNDVIAMNSDGLMVAHEHAFVDQPQHVAQLQQVMGEGFRFITLPEALFPLGDAVASYLFNSQILSIDGRYTLIAPQECAEIASAQAAIRFLMEEQGAIAAVHYPDVRESMRNGGGPACLRLRVTMTAAEAAAMHPGIILDDARDDALVAWVTRHYRDRLHLDDFRDPALLDELNTAYDALATIIDMPGFYQQNA